MSLTISASMAVATPALTTTFVPKATCTENRLTMLANKADEIWVNEILPVPGATFTDCYASQFANSYLTYKGGFTLPAFSPLQCPQNYDSDSGVFPSNYIACCPSGYTLHPPDSPQFTNRPAFGGTCYSPIKTESPVRVTSYGLKSLGREFVFSATRDGEQAFAYPYEGFAYGVSPGQSITSNSATTTPSSSTPASSTASSTASNTGSAAAATYTVLANADPVFTPNTIAAKLGDTILFEFLSGNHSITESTFDNPCSALDGGQDSGLMTNINGTVTPTPEVSFLVTKLGSQWFFSKGTDDCGAGMTFALNPSSIQTQAKFQQAAIAQGSHSTSSKSTGLSTGTKVAIGVVIPLVALVAIAILLFFLRRRRRSRTTTPEASQIQQSPAQPTDYHDTSPGVGAAQDYYAIRDYKSPPTDSTTSPRVAGSELETTGSSYLHGGHSSSEVHGDSAASELPVGPTPAVEMSGERFNRYSHSWQDSESPNEQQRR